MIATDSQAKITFMNPIAESLTGWNQHDAVGKPLDRDILKCWTKARGRTVENPAAKALGEGDVVGPADHNVLISREGTERPIDDSCAPIRNAQAETIGVVLVFRDVTERQATESALMEAKSGCAWPWMPANRFLGLGCRSPTALTWSDRMYALHGVESGSIRRKNRGLYDAPASRRS